MDAIVIDGFRKTYGGLTAVHGISLTVGQGELFGLIGPDGAGKTSLIRSLCTLIPADAGTLTVMGLDTGRDVREIRSRLGYMPQRFSLYQDLSVAQNLRFFADLFQVSGAERDERLEALYRFSQLAPFRERKAGALSGGMKQKLALSCALIHTPEVLILDEPTYGVDPLSRREFWRLLRQIQSEGTTVLASTAYMDEADQCDRVALMHRGDLKAVDTPDNLRAAYPHPLYRVRGEDVRALRSLLAASDDVVGTQLFGDAVHVSFREAPDEADWREWERASDGNLTEWSPQTPSMEDVFMAVAEDEA